MDQSKAWYTSKTIWGLIISLGGKIVAGVWGLNIEEAELVELTDTVVMGVSLLVSVAGDLFAWYGRIKATKEISSNVM